jgi:hypothetical protein
MINTVVTEVEESYISRKIIYKIELEDSIYKEVLSFEINSLYEQLPIEKRREIATEFFELISSVVESDNA